MFARLATSAPSVVRLPAALLIAGAMLAGCTTAGASPSGSGSPGGSGTPSGSSSASGFYLRTYRTQALAPQYTFGWLPTSTISDGQYIDGLVAVPTIYPGPIYTGLSARTISSDGIDAIIAEARKDGLLDSKTDFSGEPAPGSVLTHVDLAIDGVSHDLVGPLPTDTVPASAAPGTSAAYETFWAKITSIETWLSADLGPSSPYAPTRLAVLLTPAADATGAPTAPAEQPWPLAGTFAAFGQPMGSTYRCGTVTGSDLATLLPVFQAGNALTRFVDSTGAKVSVQAVVLVPGDPGPCA
jgi:hypothetical protein